MYNYIKKLFMGTACLYAGIAFAVGPHSTEKSMSLAEESQMAMGLIEKEDNLVALRVYGLICESCAYGINRKLSKLKFIDKDRLKKGIELDVYNQFLKIAIKADATISVRSIYEAIDDAGYEPKTLFLMGSIETIDTEGEFTVTEANDVRFQLAREEQLGLLEHGKGEHPLMIVAPVEKGKKAPELITEVELVDTIHES